LKERQQDKQKETKLQREQLVNTKKDKTNTANKETGAMGREIESRQDIEW
jgi:hypothetical protein